MKIVLMILFLALTSPAHADWTKTDTAFQVGYSILHVIDWGTTRDIAKNPNKFHELNPILGKHPSVGEVDTYMTLSLIGHTVVSSLLPSEYKGWHVRRWWQGMTIGFKGGLVINNFSIGLKVNF